MKVLKKDGQPYNMRRLRKDNPQVSFPKVMTAEQLAEWGITRETVVKTISPEQLMVNAVKKKYRELDEKLQKNLRSALIAQLPAPVQLDANQMVVDIEAATTPEDVESIDVSSL